jgi:glycosyltransferase involved in cell wall biosynthesis
MKNILLVGNWPSDTGYAWWLMETFWIAIANRFRSVCRVIVCYPKLTTVPPRLAAANIEVIEFDYAGATNAQLQQFIKTQQIGSIYLTDKSYVSWRYLLLRLNGVGRIIVHDHMPGVRRSPGPLKRLIKRGLGSVPAITADAYVAVSEHILQRLREVACLPPARCHLARNGVDTDRIALTRPGNIRAEIGIPADALLVVSSGRMTEYKNIRTIVEAANILINQKSTQQLFFIHCGDGPERESLAQLIDSLGLKGRFILLGGRDDVLAILKASDFAVHASKGEGLSLSILEFMGSGLPVIVSDDPTVAQTVEQNVTGLLFQTGNAADLAARLEQLLGSQPERARLGAAAAAEVVAHYSLNSTVAVLVGIFEQLLSDTAREQTTA